jgi:hypothetical protein
LIVSAPVPESISVVPVVDWTSTLSSPAKVFNCVRPGIVAAIVNRSSPDPRSTRTVSNREYAIPSSGSSAAMPRPVMRLDVSRPVLRSVSPRSST